MTGGKSKGKKKSKDDDFTWEWEKERLRAITLLYNLVQLNISQLFDPPTIEEEVVNLVANTCFKILENPTLAHQRTKDTRAGITQVLGTLSRKFNYTLWGLPVWGVLTRASCVAIARDLDCVELWCGVGAVWNAVAAQCHMSQGFDLKNDVANNLLIVLVLVVLAVIG